MTAFDVIRLPRLARRLTPRQAAQYVEAWCRSIGVDVLHQAALTAVDLPRGAPQREWYDGLEAEYGAIGDLCRRIRWREPDSVVLATALVDRWQAFRRESRYRVVGVPEAWLRRPIEISSE